MKKELSISVGISTYNRNDDLVRCLVSLEQQTDRDFTVIIANGGDTSGVMQVVQRFPQLRIAVVDQERRGVVEARNLAWRHSSADVVCLIDDDLVVDKQWLAQVRKTFLADDRVGGVSGPTLIPEDRQKNRDLALFLEEFRRSRNILLRLIGYMYFDIILENKMFAVGRILKSGAFTPGSNYPSCLKLEGLQEVDYLEACHMCFRRHILEKLNGFSYRYLGTGEWNEPDFAFQVRRQGYRLVFNPQAVTYHYISQAGVFKARTNSYERSLNFIFFYMRWIKPNTLAKAVRFGINLFFINAYWFYKFLQSKNPDWLYGIWGTCVGLVESRKVRSPL